MLGKPMRLARQRNSSANSATSNSSSRYFGRSMTGGIGIVGRESISTVDTFLDEQHIMSLAEIEYQPSDLEHELIEEVTEQVRQRLVYGEGSTSWGLRWECGTVDEPDYLLGGWLAHVRHSKLSSSISSGHPRFYVLQDDRRELQQCPDERLKVSRVLTYDEIHAVRPRCVSNKKDAMWYVQIFGRNVRWELMPVNLSSRDIVLRWTAALQFRTGTYEATIAGDVSRATRAAIFAQSKFRMWKAKEKVNRKREKANRLMNRLANAVGYTGWEDGDSDEEDEGFVSGYLNTSALNTALTVVGSWLGMGGAATIAEAEEDDLALSSKSNMRDSSFVQFSNDLPQLEMGAVEDEVWENQRWGPGIGWASITLGGAERCAFTDRLGRGSFKSPKTPDGGVPMCQGWTSIGDYRVDLSGVNKGRCDKDGFVYALDWHQLDTDLAKGKFVAQCSPKDFVRRRRWYRRRVREHLLDLQDTIPPIVMEGWLGFKSASNGRWLSRYFVLTRAGLRISQKATKRPMITRFRFTFKEYLEVLQDGGVDGSKWNTLSDKQATMFELDQRYLKLDDRVATANNPGYFSVSLDGKQVRIFNANDAISRDRWICAIRDTMEESRLASRPRTMRLVGGAFETSSYPTIIMDSLLVVPVDAVEEAFFQSPSVLAAVNVNSKFRQVKVEPWDGTKRSISYIDDKRGGLVSETWIRARTEPGKGFVVDRRIEAPNAQFGDEYATKCRMVLVAAESKGRHATRVLASVDVDFIKQTMMVGCISSEARKSMTLDIREVWLPAVVTYLEGKGLIQPSPLVDSKHIAWNYSQVGSSKSRALASEDSGGITVDQI